MIDWNKLEAFYHVVQMGSFTNAAQMLNVNQSCLSRHVIDLETALNAQLLNRSRLGITLTPKGSALFNFAERTFNEQRKIESRLIEIDLLEKNRLTIALAKSYGLPYLTLALRDFLKAHQSFHVTLDDQPLRGHYEKYDAYIGPGFVQLKGYIKEPLYSYRTRLYASKQYLKQMGTPKTLEDLAHHHLITYKEGEEAADWLSRFNKRFKISLKPRLVVNSPFLLLNAVESNVGIVSLRDDFLVGNQKFALTEILTPFASPLKEVFLIYHESKTSKEALKLFKKYLEVHKHL
jgi:DNA-binding transcriptional LysR family regulator